MYDIHNWLMYYKILSVKNIAKGRENLINQPSNLSVADLL